MRGVLIDQHQVLPGLAEDVGQRQLADHPDRRPGEIGGGGVRDLQGVCGEGRALGHPVVTPAYGMSWNVFPAARGRSARQCIRGLRGDDMEQRNAVQGPPDLSLNVLEQLPLPHEPDLGLSRMDVGIDIFRSDAHGKHGGRMPVLGNQGVVRLRERARQQGAPDRSVVDEEPLVRSPALGHLWGAEDSGERARGSGCRELQGVRSHLRAEDPACPVGKALGGTPEDFLALVGQPERDLGRGQGQRLDRFNDHRALPRRRFEKSPARGRVEEEAFDADGGALGAARGPEALLGAARDDDRHGICPLDARHHLDAGDRRNAGQGLTAEAVGAHVPQILGGANLARGKALERQRHLRAGDACAVVADLNEPLAGPPDLDGDPPGAGVEAVLDQFLHDRRRTFHHLSRRDALGGALGEDLDAGGCAHVRRGVPCDGNGITVLAGRSAPGPRRPDAC